MAHIKKLTIFFFKFQGKNNIRNLICDSKDSSSAENNILKFKKKLFGVEMF